jgi:sulfur-carrier protein adenylyltransferase/sulfurtransferase
MNMTVKELKALRDANTPHFLLDVRQPDEHALCRIEGSTLIPLGELPGRLGDLPKDRTIVVHCHHGGRSMQAVRFLREQGYEKAVNLAGGIDAWSEEIDPNVPRY